jgi:hypothetical protein
MKNPNPLDRLLHSAAQAPTRPADLSELSPAMERRILAHWRGTMSSGNTEFLDLLALFRRGLAFATVVAVTTVALSFKSTPHEETDELAITDATFELALR